MFSVNNLLVSQEYKQSKNPTNSSENPDDGDDQHEDTGRQSGQASQSDLPIHAEAICKTNKARRYQNDDKSNLVIRGRQRSAYNENFRGPSNVRGRLYDQSKLSRSSYCKKENQLTYWRRQGQDFSAHDYPDRVDSETRGLDATCALLESENQSQWETEEGLENMRSNKQETMRPSGDYRRQSLNRETWKQPTTFVPREPDIDDKERLHQDVYLERRTIAASHVNNKLQSLPKFLSPENSKSAEIPAIASSKQPKVKPELESLKHTEPATRPKYGRPLNPPSYEFHQQSRGIVEINPPQDEQQKCNTTFYVTKVDEPGQDATLEPPVYIPPPSYKSPGQQSKNKHVPEEVSDYDECFAKEKQGPGQNICISSESLVSQLQMEEEEQIFYGSKTQVRCQESHLSSVQYIPFNDPRIRHIKVIHPFDHQMEVQTDYVNNNIFYNNSVDQDSCSLATQRGSYNTGNNMNCEYPRARPSAQSPSTTKVSSEVLTKVKTFEPGTEIQGKNHLKTKTNETMFCLVSIPLQPETTMPVSLSEKDGPDSNRNLKDQSFLSTSSTDLELQALTGNMINKNVLEKQDFQRPAFKQTNDLSCKQPPKHKELEYSGSWPCTRYKDQQTQTSFGEDPEIQQPLHGSQLRKSNTLTNGHFLKYGSSTTESAPSSLPTDNRKGRPIPPPRKAQLNKPIKHECPTAVGNPKINQNEPHATGLPGWKNEPSFAHKEERKSPCNVKEAFGQFLLKPVSRRPWDAISELESFNKEIQKQEERSEDDKVIEQKQEEKACKVDEVSQDNGCNAQTRKIKPVFKKGTDKSKPESENTFNIWDTRIPISNLRHVRSQAREMDKSVKGKMENVDLKQKQENARKIIKQAIGLHPMKSNVSGPLESENSSIPFHSINSREVNVENHKKKVSDKLKKAAGRNVPASETASVKLSSFKRRNQGRSEPNLRSVGLDVNERTSIPDSSTKKIPPNESLQTRASRILGIEVAVESLTENKTLPDEDSVCDNMAKSGGLSNKKILRAEMKTDVASSKGKPKSAGSKPTFIGENIVGPAKDQRDGRGRLTRIPSLRYRSDLSKGQEVHTCSLESVMPPPAERKSVSSNVEKQTRSTSKVTVPRQGKVASAVSRAAMDRIARMREVDTVSRMRRLSIKNAGSGEDNDEDNQQSNDFEGKGNDSAVGCTEFPRKLSQGSCVSKRIISLNENERLGNKNAKKNGKDLPSSEVYDPSRVERV